jgi:hypothetical protein
MIGERIMAILARIVHGAAFHLNRDDVCGSVIMLAACLRIQIDAPDI